jgi:hypothetical protein
MVTTVSSYKDTKNRAFAGEGFDGVVRVVVGNQYGSGVLLFDGTAVLTAAHLFANASAQATVHFETRLGASAIGSREVLIHPDYNASNSHNDLALVWLSQDAPVAAERYALYRSSAELGQTMTMVGYGTPGLGSTGTLTSFNEAPIRLKAKNQFDTDSASLAHLFDPSDTWTATGNTQLVADFDNGLAQNDALGRLINKQGLGLGALEGLISKGDSGGPAFIGNLVAGTASFTARVNSAGRVPDVDALNNSSFGEIGGWQRVSTYQQWIDQSLSSRYVDKPQSQADVQKVVNEGSGGSVGNWGTTPAYFWVQLHGFRTNPLEVISVDYATRSGSALAGQDFLGTQGRLNLYPHQSHALIMVEIIADTAPEEDETFYLDIFNPIGASFGEGVVKLTAMRTIANDDGWFWG